MTAPDKRFDFLWEDFEQMFSRSRTITPCERAAYKACFYAGAWAAAWRISTHSPNDAWIQDFMLHLKSTINEHYLTIMSNHAATQVVD